VVVRKGVVRVTARFRKEVHRRLAQDAKAHGVSINDEIERRIESSFATEDWQAERLNMQAERLDLLTALQLALVSNPQASAIRARLTEIGSRKNWISKIVNLPELLKPIPPAVAGETESEDNLPSPGQQPGQDQQRAEKQGKAG
jgi:hypothetical protein